MGGNGGTPEGTSGTIPSSPSCGTVGGGATQTAAGVNAFHSDYYGVGMTGGPDCGGGGGGLWGGAGGRGAAGGGGSSKYDVSSVAGFTFVSGAYGVAASAVSGSVSITHTLLANTQAFSYLANMAQSYTIPSGTQYLDFVVIG